jgi:uncharacterized membrane protein YhaH (DUF805 family)
MAPCSFAAADRQARLLGYAIDRLIKGAGAMNFVDAIKSGFDNYVGFSGRAARSEYWFWTLFVIVANVIAAIVDALLGLGFIEAIVSLGLFLPGIAVSIRRLHDIDRTGWWLLIAFTGVGLIVLLVFDCIKGTTGPNRFGPDPLGI